MLYDLISYTTSNTESGHIWRDISNILDLFQTELKLTSLNETDIYNLCGFHNLYLYSKSSQSISIKNINYLITGKLL